LGRRPDDCALWLGAVHFTQEDLFSVICKENDIVVEARSDSPWPEPVITPTGTVDPGHKVGRIVGVIVGCVIAVMSVIILAVYCRCSKPEDEKTGTSDLSSAIIRRDGTTYQV
jgi:hypothetical protein